VKVVPDPHALYHAVESPSELTDAGRQVLEDPANDLLISAITVWEFGLHAERGRVQFVGVDAWVDAALASIGVRVVPIDVSIVRRTFMLDGFDRKDPADRIITATALVEGAVLVTRDEWIVKWSEVRTLW
jgi:PIN domain nuclease of toxin-antitoxin system